MSGSVNASKSKINSDYASVAEQSGLKAGDGGFQVEVQGTTDLKGAVIASTQRAVEAGQNSFKTAALTTSDLQNKASYSAESLSVNLGAGMNPSGKLVPGGTGAGFGTDSGNASSTTLAGISGIAGHKDVRTGDQETGIQKIFDAEKVQKDIEAQTKITQRFNELAPKAAADYAGSQVARLKKQAESESDPDQQKALIDEAKKWAPNGTYNIAMNIIIGAAGGGASGATSAVTKETLSWAANEMRQAMIEDSKKFKGICDAQGNCISNMSGQSAGVNGDNIKIAGGRIVLADWCADGRCEKDPTGTTDSGYVEDAKGRVVFDPGKDANGSALTISKFIDKYPDLSSPLGGHQGAQGQMSLFGIQFDYAKNSFWDKLAEGYSGTHDTFNSLIWYDKLGNGKDLSGTAIGVAGNVTNITNVGLATPFALSVILPPEFWDVVSELLKIK